MLTDVEIASDPAPTLLSRAPRLSADLAVWLTSDRNELELRRELKQIGALQQHSVTTLQAVNNDANLWRCGFAYVGRQPDREAHLLAMLRRIGVIAQWRRVERLAG